MLKGIGGMTGINVNNNCKNDLFILLTGRHSKYTLFDMLNDRYNPALQDLSVSLNKVQ